MPVRCPPRRDRLTSNSPPWFLHRPLICPRPDVDWVPVVPEWVLTCGLGKASFVAELVDSLPRNPEISGDVDSPPGPIRQEVSPIREDTRRRERFSCSSQEDALDRLPGDINACPGRAGRRIAWSPLHHFRIARSFSECEAESRSRWLQPASATAARKVATGPRQIPAGWGPAARLLLPLVLLLGAVQEVVDDLLPKGRCLGVVGSSPLIRITLTGFEAHRREQL